MGGKKKEPNLWEKKGRSAEELGIASGKKKLYKEVGQVGGGQRFAGVKVNDGKIISKGARY